MVPKYWVTIAVVLIVYQFAGLTAGITSSDVITHVLFVNALTDSHYRAIDGTWWFPSAIATLYVSYLLVRPLVARGRWALVLLAGLAFETVAILAQQRWGPSPASSAVWQEATPRIMDFYLGAAAGTYFRGRQVGVGERPLSMLAAVAATLAASFWCYVKSPGSIQTVTLGLGVAILGLILGVAARHEAAPRLLTAAVVWVSVASYEIYLVHNPLVETLNLRWFSRFGWPGSGRTHLILGGIVGLAIAFVLAEGLRRLPTDGQSKRERRSPTSEPVLSAEP